MKRLLIITTNFPPSVSIGTQRIIRICKYLDPADWNISVLTLKEDYYSVRKSRSNNGHQEIFNKLTIYRTNKVDVVTFLLKLRGMLRFKKNNSSSTADREGIKKSSEFSKNSAGFTPNRTTWQLIKDFITDIFQFPDKHITWLPFAVLKGYRIIKKEKIDVLYCSSPPHSLQLISTILKKLTGAKLVVDFRDPWARSPWRAEMRAINSFERWKHRRIKKFERWVIKSADNVVLITRQMRDDFVKFYYGLPPEKFHFFPNGYDPENLRFAPEYSGENGNMPAKVTFIHAGSLYKHRDPSPILDALKNLLDRGEIDKTKVSFLFIGGISDELAHVPAMVNDANMGDVVTFIPPVSYQKAMEYMAESQILILLQPATKLQLPGKFFDYLCLGKPIFAVGEKESAVEHTVSEGYGIFADYNNVSDIEKGILFLYNHPRYNIDLIKEKRQVFDISQSILSFSKILNS